MSKIIDKITVNSGTSSICSINFSNSFNTGIFSSSQNVINLCTNGTSQVQINTTDITLNNPLVTISGNLGTPAIKIGNNCSVYTDGTTISYAISGSDVLRINSTTVEIVNSELKCASATITGFTSSGIVHSNPSGNLSNSLIVNSDISSSAEISNSKLAGNPSSTNTANTIVLRDSSGNSSHGTITCSQLSLNNIIYPNPSSLSDSVYVLTSASNTLTYTTLSSAIGSSSIYGTRGYLNSSGYSFTTSGSSGTYTSCSSNGNVGSANNGVTQTSTGLTILTAGVYRITAMVSFEGSGNTNYLLTIGRVNGGTTLSPYSSECQMPAVLLNTNTLSLTITDIISCSTNDAVVLYMAASSASNNITIVSWNLTVNKI
jgi:hypothetical protein